MSSVDLIAARKYPLCPDKSVLCAANRVNGGGPTSISTFGGNVAGGGCGNGNGIGSGNDKAENGKAEEAVLVIESILFE